MPSPKSGLFTRVVGLLWLVTVIAGTCLMVWYSNLPGKSGFPPAQWPAASHVPRDPALPVLVMFIHPHCPCSRASICELALLMARCQGRVNTHVLFVQPAGMSASWTQTDSWRSAAAIPGVAVDRDEAGREARLFNAETSGDTILYDAKGELVFHGGITISRGHSGDNPGRSALQALLFGEQTQLTSTPVFGCSLDNCPVPAKP